jgi:hypothetical protein
VASAGTVPRPSRNVWSSRVHVAVAVNVNA